MSNINNIIVPVKNNQTKDSRVFAYTDKGFSQLTISVIADRNLTLILHQAYNEVDFIPSEPVEYIANDGNKLFNFDKDGELFFFTLTNSSGVDCVFTRAFADFTVATTNINDILTHTKLDSLNGNIQALNQSLVNLQKQSPVYYRELGDAYYAFCPEFTTSTTDNVEFAAFNPVDSNKTIYLYHISFSSKAPVTTTDYNVTVKMDKITDVVGGTDLTAFQKGNLNLALDTQSSLLLRTKPQSISGAARILNKRLEKTGDSNIISFQREFIEIPPGHGVSFTVQSTSNTVSMTFNLRYFEEAQDAPDVIQLTSIIPDVDPQGNSIRTNEGGLNVYTWQFTTSNETLYDLFSLTNNFTLTDNENITKLYVAGDIDQTNLLLNNIVVSTGGISVNAEGEMIFQPNMADPTNPQANITLAPNTTFEFKSRTTFNDPDLTEPDIKLAIVERINGGVLELQYLNVAIAS